MIRVVPFCADHLAALDGRNWIDPSVAALGAAGRAFSAFSAADGAMLMCGGALQTHAEYATLWSCFAPHAIARLREMVAIRQRTRWFIEGLPHRRIDTLVRSDHRAGHRWIHALGFVPEGRLNDYFEDGGDAMMYRLKR